MTAVTINYPVTQRALEVADAVLNGGYPPADGLPIVEAAIERVPDRIVGREARKHARLARRVSGLAALHLLGAGTFKAEAINPEAASDADLDAVSHLAKLSSAFSTLRDRLDAALGGGRHFDR